MNEKFNKPNKKHGFEYVISHIQSPHIRSFKNNLHTEVIIGKLNSNLSDPPKKKALFGLVFRISFVE